MKIVVAGASGMIGGALRSSWRAAGHDVVRLVRRKPEAPDEIAWDPAAGWIDESRLNGVEAVVNLAGENVGAGRWTAARRAKILQSRVESTRTLVATVERMRSTPRVFLNASAVGIYGDRADEVLTEESRTGAGFLADVCRSWEAEAERASQYGVRTVRLRLGVVLSTTGGALPKMLPVFRAGIGGQLGTGRQWMSWVALQDVVRVIAQALEDERIVGAVNVSAPNPVINAEFTRTLGHVLSRPTVLRVPAFALRALFGRMADETLLASQRVVPARLSDWGFRFREETLENALRATLRQDR